MVANREPLITPCHIFIVLLPEFIVNDETCRAAATRAVEGHSGRCSGVQVPAAREATEAEICNGSAGGEARGWERKARLV